MNRFFLPFSYLLYSRLSTTIEKISWSIIYVVPMLFVSIVISNFGVLQSTILTLLAKMGYISLYEIGYLENDIQATLKENQPTQRIQVKDYRFFVEYFKKLILIRYFYVFCVLLILYTITWIYDFKLYVGQYVFMMLISRIAFILHNLWRDRSNIVTFAVLQITKYLTIPLLFIAPESALLTLMILFCIYPLVRTMEYASSEKFKFQTYRVFIGNHDSFRVKYYSVLLILSMLIYCITENVEERIFVIGLTIYFLLFRVVALLCVKKGICQR